jgi:predicted ATPase
MHRIIFTGAQGTGKTTVLNTFKEYYGINTITEVVRNLSKKGVKINKDGDESGQAKIFKEYEKLLSATTKDGYLSDRGLFDVVAYTMYLNRIGKVSDKFLDGQLKKLNKFLKTNSDITYCYFPIEFDLVDDGVRDMDVEFQKEIDSNIQRLLEASGVNVVWIFGTVERRIKTVATLYDWLSTGFSLFTMRPTDPPSPRFSEEVKEEMPTDDTNTPL